MLNRNKILLGFFLIAPGLAFCQYKIEYAGHIFHDGNGKISPNMPINVDGPGIRTSFVFQINGIAAPFALAPNGNGVIVYVPPTVGVGSASIVASGPLGATEPYPVSVAEVLPGIAGVENNISQALMYHTGLFNPVTTTDPVFAGERVQVVVAGLGVSLRPIQLMVGGKLAEVLADTVTEVNFFGAQIRGIYRADVILDPESPTGNQQVTPGVGSVQSPIFGPGKATIVAPGLNAKYKQPLQDLVSWSVPPRGAGNQTENNHTFSLNKDLISAGAGQLSAEIEIPKQAGNAICTMSDSVCSRRQDLVWPYLSDDETEYIASVDVGFRYHASQIPDYPGTQNDVRFRVRLTTAGRYVVRGKWVDIPAKRKYAGNGMVTPDSLYDVSALLPQRYVSSSECRISANLWATEEVYTFLDLNKSRLFINEISAEHGPKIWPHEYHRLGRDIDIFHFFKFPGAESCSLPDAGKQLSLLRSAVVASISLAEGLPPGPGPDNRLAQREALRTWIGEMRSGMQWLDGHAEVLRINYGGGYDFRSANFYVSSGYIESLLFNGSLKYRRATGTSVEQRTLSIEGSNWSCPNGKCLKIDGHQAHLHLVMRCPSCLE